MKSSFSIASYFIYGLIMFMPRKLLLAGVLSALVSGFVCAEDRHSMSSEQVQLMHDVSYGVLTARAAKNEKIKAENAPLQDEIKTLRERVRQWEKAEVELSVTPTQQPMLASSSANAPVDNKLQQEKQRQRDAAQQDLKTSISKIKNIRKIGRDTQQQQDDAVLNMMDSLSVDIDDIGKSKGIEKYQKMAALKEKLGDEHALRGADDRSNPGNMKPTFKVDTSSVKVIKTNKPYVVGGDNHVQ